MREFIKQYQNPNVVPLNMALINHYYDSDLVPFIVDAFKSLEVIPNIKILGYRYETNPRNINMNEFIRTRNNSKSQKQLQTKYIFMEESRIAMISIDIQLTWGDETKVITKNLIVPVRDKDGYYLIKGT